ncbi:hypothetical protein [Brachybacterium vulturis]|uniref:hypothetical protein n=1 Tax=Brachybacterium vulturis TaxID=2017484 RepID=UPI0037358FF3
MTSPRRDTIYVPLYSNAPPYRIDEAVDGDCCVRIRRGGPDLLVLVPPGDGAPEFRSRLIAELQAYSVRSIVTRSFGGLLSMLLPRFGLAVLVTATYPADPLDALRDIPDSGLRYLTADELSGGPAMESLRRTLLESPSTVRPEERSALWILSARDEYYASALSAVRRLAELRFDESIRARSREFSVEMQVALDELETAAEMAPPTSAW